MRWSAAERTRALASVGVLACLAAVALHAAAAEPPAAATGSDAGCSAGVTPEASRELYQRLKPVQGVDGCELQGVDTARSRITLTWKAGGDDLPPIVVLPSVCVPDAGGSDAAYALAEGPGVKELAARCPTAHRIVLETIGASSMAPPSRFGDDPRAAVGIDATFVVGLLVMILTAALSIALLVRLVRRGELRPRRTSSAALLGIFVLALAVRFYVEADLTNWYSEVLTADEGLRGSRFGPGAFVFQAVLRAIFPWSDTTIFAANRVLGSLSIALFFVILRQCGVDGRTALYAAIVAALSPIHVRCSASPSEHLLSSTLTFALVASWLYACRKGDRLAAAFTLSAVAAVAFTRADGWVQLAAVPIWALLAVPRSEMSRPRASVWRMNMVYGAVWAVIGVAAYLLVVLPSKHPRPEMEAVLFAAERFLQQFWELGFEPPYWLTTLAVVLAIPGALVMFVRRPGLFLTALATLVIALVPLGRNLSHDALVGARYFLFAIPVFTLLGGYALGSLVELIAWMLSGRGGGSEPEVAKEAPPSRGTLLGRMAGAALVVGLIVAAFLSGRQAYDFTYTFQEEYRFLRKELSKLDDGCVVHQLLIRADGLEKDLDCCLDIPRSPLTIAFPSLRFESISDPATDLGRDAEGADATCQVYYETAACSLQPTEEVRERRPRSKEIFDRRCAELRERGLTPIVETEVSPRATHQLFDGVAPTVGLYRLPL